MTNLAVFNNELIALAISSLSLAWQNSGIKPGDTVLLHSNITRTLRMAKRNYCRNIGLNEILLSFLDAVGSEGTLIVPLFNFDFTKGLEFDANITPSHMGALTEFVRLHPESTRSGHPIYSFAAIGKYSEAIGQIDNFSAYGSDSPFQRLLDWNGKIAILDLEDQDSMTFYHFVEESCKVDYRYYKTFQGYYTNKVGTRSWRSYAIYVRDISRGIITDVNTMGEELWDKGIYKGCRPGVLSGLRVAVALDVYNHVYNTIKSGTAEGKLYSISN